MLQNSIRKHRRWWLIAVLLLMGGPLIFFMGSFGLTTPGASMDSITVGYVEDIEITQADLARYFQQEMSRINQSGGQANVGDLMADGTLPRIREQVFKEKLMEREVDDLNLSFERDFLANQLKEDPYFQNEDGSFNSAAWNKFVEDRNVDWNAYARSGDILVLWQQVDDIQGEQKRIEVPGP